MKAEKKFEEEWRDAFEGAEVTPSNAVWTGIDLELANAESSSMKKRVVFYQRLAAAAVLFALLVGGFGVYRWNENEKLVADKNNERGKATENKAFNKEEKKTIADLTENKNSGNDNPSISSSLEKEQPGQPQQVSKEGAKNSFSNPKQKTAESFANTKKESADLLPSNNAAIDPLQIQPTQTVVSANLIDRTETELKKENHSTVALAAIPEAGTLPIVEIDGEPVREELVRKLPAIPGAFMIEPRSEKINHEHLWASVTAASGSFSTLATSNSLYGSSSFQSASSGNVNTGSSYSYGMLAGMRVSNRIVVQSGVQYSNLSSGTTTNINAPNSLSSVANYAYNSTAMANTTSPYAITSANEFVSVPVQAGYLFLDRKVGLQLNSGISTDFFIRNTLTDPTGQRQSYSQGSGQDSPYRAVNFSGLMSSEVSYKLGRHYRLSVVPGVRYSFAPILKSTSPATGNNMVWDIGFRFRYIFK